MLEIPPPTYQMGPSAAWISKVLFKTSRHRLCLVQCVLKLSANLSLPSHSVPRQEYRAECSVVNNHEFLWQQMAHQRYSAAAQSAIRW